MCLQIIYLIYMYKQDLPLNNLEGSTYHKTQPNQTISTANARCVLVQAIVVSEKKLRQMELSLPLT